MLIIASTVNGWGGHKHFGHFSLSIDRKYDVIFPDNASCHRAKKMKAFLQTYQLNDTVWISIQLKMNLKKLVYVKTSSCKADLSLQESWSQLDVDYFLLLSEFLNIE